MPQLQPQPEPTPQTPPGQEQTAGGPVGGPGQAPRPDLAGIAEEVGRIEQKVLLLLARPEGGGGGDLAPLADLLNQLLERLNRSYPGGSYGLDSPCETSPDGSRLPPRLAPWPPAAGFDAALLARMDSLAELLQHHKDLKQPNCARPRSTGTAATVTFSEVIE